MNLNRTNIKLKYSNYRKAYRKWFLQIFVPLFIFVSVFFPLLYIINQNFTLVEFIIVMPGVYILLFIASTAPYTGSWLRTPLWIELREDGLIYQPRNFWRGIMPRFFGKPAKEIPKGKPKFVSIKNIIELVVNEDLIDAKIFIRTDNILSNIYYFVTHKDQIFFQKELYSTIIEWYEENAPKNEKILFFHRKNSRIHKKEIFGTR